ncbi:MAG: hypothetical protein FJ295_18815 [Planctomycetes bacterium]|nr:hypothetical protein [Planctomycetota bacterium]
MSRNLLDDLSQAEIPPLPERLPESVHRRINDQLLVQHVFDFLIQGIAVALPQMLLLLSGAVWFSLTGTDLKTTDTSRKEPENE